MVNRRISVSQFLPVAVFMLIVVAAAVLATNSAGGESVSSIAAPINAERSLEDGFRNPPSSARPRVWWHWMNGNVSEDGIRKDIEWMSRVGIGGMQNFDAAIASPQVVDSRLVYMTPEWKHAFRYAAEQAEKHELELATAGSPGWSETGGPWVRPQDGMKKLVWSDVVLHGGRRFYGPLPSIPGVTGAYQDLKVQGGGFLVSSLQDFNYPQHSADVAVLAYRIMGDGSAPLPRMVTAEGDALDAAILNDGKYSGSVDVARSTAAILITYKRSQTVRALTLYFPGVVSRLQRTTLAPVFEAGNDDGSWREIVKVTLGALPTTVGFTPVTAKKFRLVLKSLSPTTPTNTMMDTMPPGVDVMGMFGAFGSGGISAFKSGPSKTIKISELSLQLEPRINAFEMKAGFALADDYYALENDTGPDTTGIAPKDIIDLTSRMGADGILDWTPPSGRWRVIRFGYSLIGTTNHPATPEATGLEVDKYDGRAVREYMETYLKMYANATGDALIGAHGLRALVTDSTEIGPANWTPDMVSQFKRLRGYNPMPWLPALTGVVVGSRMQSDAFLYDFRRTLADLMASQHYAQIAEVTRKYGLTYYSEALEGGRPTFGDDMAMRASANIPMAALWAYGKSGPQPASFADIKGAASVAHIYGQNLVAAESLTSGMAPWAFSPADLRPMIDLAFVSGINRPVIHTSVHQPVDTKQPGLALQIFGQYFNRHETWAEMAKPWVDYMARTAFLLQQGRNYADVAYFYGEEAPLVALYKYGAPKDAPRHYAYDYINADAVHGALRVEGGELVSPGGARYRLLYLGGSTKHMTVSMLRRLRELVEAGAIIVGHPPESSPSLNDNPAEFASIVKQLWGAGTGGTVGKGRVIVRDDAEVGLVATGLTPDFRYSASGADSQILFQHRKLADGEIYFLSNRTAHAEMGEGYFRVTDKRPEIWRADTGEILPVSYRIVEGETLVSLNMAPLDSFFVVFRKPAKTQSAKYETPRWAKLADISRGSWDVSFQSGRGAPTGAHLTVLKPLNENVDPGIRYFSGVAIYRKKFKLAMQQRSSQRLLLDLGQIGDVAEVRVNGVMVGTVWREPHRIDIGNYVKQGYNRLEVRVANLWVNRLIGDAQPDSKKVTWTSTRVYLPTAPLRPSGLIGPIQILAER